MPNVELPEGVKKEDLECVMLEAFLPMDIEQASGRAYDPADLYYGESEDEKYAQGAVGDATAHVTLLFGILPRVDYEMAVYEALDGWDIPNKLYIDQVIAFPVPPEQEYVPVVAKVVPRADLVGANKRLRELPYSNRFTTYIPHITLVYLKKTADIDKWVEALNESFAYKIIDTGNIDLGLDD